MRNRGRSITTRVTPGRPGASGVAPSSAARSSSVAAFCTLSIAPGGACLGLRSDTRNFCAASGNDSMSDVASSLSEYIKEPAPAAMPSRSTAAPRARGTRQPCRRSTIGDSA